MILIIKEIQTDYSTFTYTNIGNIKNVLGWGVCPQSEAKKEFRREY